MTSYPITHIRVVAFLIAALIVIIAVLPSAQEQETARLPISLAVESPATEPTIPTELPQNNPEWKEVTVRRGDNLSLIFTRLGISATVLHDVLASGYEASKLKRLTPGEVLRFHLTESDELVALEYEKTALQSLRINKVDGSYSAVVETNEPEVITAFKTARITAEAPSLYHAGKKAGLSDNIIMQLSSVFQWDISFALDLRQGDTFSLIYEELFVEGEKVKEGKILAAQFRNMGKDYVAVLYEDQNGIKGHYTPDGRSLRKAFLRDPVHFSHVSSSFNLRRLHPIHKRVMPHRGIDYAARRGTPVVAAGDGKVTISRQNSASGKYVVIQHGQQYTTKYLHLSNFAKGIRSGKSVSQGQVIGYVGATGWATAAHLHYEFLVNGVHRNPRTVKLPKAEPILAGNMGDFRNQTSPMLMRLASIAGSTNLALARNGKEDNPG